MQVILLERIGRLGQMGDIVKVRPGFARNFLLPQGKALRATKDNMTHFEKERTQLEATNLQRKQEAEAVAMKLDGLSFVVLRQAGDTGQLYGSVSTRDIADAVTAWRLHHRPRAGSPRPARSKIWVCTTFAWDCIPKSRSRSLQRGAHRGRGRSVRPPAKT